MNFVRREAQISGCEHDKAEWVSQRTATWLRGNAQVRAAQRRPGRLAEQPMISSKRSIGRAGERA